MTFATPLHRRMRQADALRCRYRSDEAYRLHKVNSGRAKRGLPLVTAADEIGHPFQRERVGNKFVRTA